MGNSKKYGEKYARRHLLQYGDITNIAVIAGLKPISVTQQLSGYRKLQPVIKSLADRFADKTESLMSQNL
jgi:hypothetical protein